MTTPTTGLAPGMLQDDSRGLSKWLAEKPDALQHVKAQPVKAALEDQEINALWADALKYGDPTAGNAHIRFARALLAQSQQSAAIAQPVTDLERYITANYPDARGETITARVIDALETMDIALGMRDIAQTVQPKRELLTDSQVNEITEACWNAPGYLGIQQLLRRVSRAVEAALLQPIQPTKPVAWFEYNQDLDAWFLAYGYNPKAKTRPLVFGDIAQPVPGAPA